jgi:hypothetical protein
LQAVVRPPLHDNIVLAGLDAHAPSIKPGLLAQHPAAGDQVTGAT